MYLCESNWDSYKLYHYFVLKNISFSKQTEPKSSLVKEIEKFSEPVRDCKENVRFGLGGMLYRRSEVRIPLGVNNL